MHVWNPSQYLKFAAERGQPMLDLVARVGLRRPEIAAAIDLGCGPGNSTAVLARQWPQAAITGLDASAEMLATARREVPAVRFVAGDITDWAAADADRSGERYDLVLSNAALQWIDDLGHLVPRLLAHVAPGGALAFQIPASWDSPANQIPRRLAASAAWRHRIPADLPSWHTEELAFFYERLAPRAAAVELWETEYVHVMENAEAILEWYRGSGLRPVLQALTSDAERERFCGEYLEGLRAAYPPQANGRILFPFRRRFVIAWAAA